MRYLQGCAASAGACALFFARGDTNMTELEAVAPLIVAYGVNILAALVILVIGWIAAGWFRRATRRALDKSVHIDTTLKPMVANGVRYLVLGFVILAVLAKFGVQTASILALVGAAGLALGLALQGTLSNVASGLMLVTLRPFGIGDYIDAEGVAGTVSEIGLFATELETFDGVYVMVPNAQLFGRAIRNYSRLPLRRVDVPVGISYRDDIQRAFQAASQILKADGRILEDKPPEVMVTGLGASSVDINLRCWTRREDYWGLFFDLQRRVKETFDAEGISIPFPQREVHLISEARETA